MTPTRVVLTYRDYAALPSEGRRYEIHEGELSVTAAPRTRHQEIIGNLFAALRAHVIARGLGKVFVATERLRIVSERGIEGPPTLVVEISARVSGDEPLSAEPLADLVIPPASLWA